MDYFICELEDRTIEMTQSEQQREKRLIKQKKNSLRDLWNYNQGFNIVLSFVLEGKEKACMREKVFEE